MFRSITAFVLCTSIWAQIPVDAARSQTPDKPELKESDRKESNRNDPEIVKMVHGDFVLRSGIVNGNAMTADRIANISAKVTDRTITTYDGQREQRFGAGYRILNDKRPWQIALKSVKKIKVDESKTREKIDESEGILDLSEDGKRLKLAYTTDGSPRPKDFKGGPNQNVFEFERLPGEHPK